MAEKNLLHEMLDSTPSSQVVSVGTTFAEFVPRSEKRVALIISPVGTGNTWIQWTISGTANQGLMIRANGDPLVLSRALHGALVVGPIYAMNDNSAQPTCYAECLSNCACVG